MSNAATGEEFALAAQKYRNLKRIYKWRGHFYLPPLLVMAFCFWNECENDLIIWPFGLSIMALSLVIRVWAITHIGRRIPRKYKHGRRPLLVLTGPYSLVRNPLYIGNIVAMIGLCLLSELVWFMPIVFAYFFLHYSLVVRYEEYKLSVLFGREYESYCRKVPRWIPRFSMIGTAKRGSFTWTRALKAELSGIASSSVMIVVLSAKETIGW